MDTESFHEQEKPPEEAVALQTDDNKEAAQDEG